MTHEQVQAYNQAIKDSVAAYKNGIGAIKALKINKAVTIEHIDMTPKQEVTET